MVGYNEYQPINLPWLNVIPSHWEVRRNKNIFSETKEEVGHKFSKYTLLSLTINGIIPRDMSGGGKFPASFDSRGYLLALHFHSTLYFQRTYWCLIMFA